MRPVLTSLRGISGKILRIEHDNLSKPNRRQKGRVVTMRSLRNISHRLLAGSFVGRYRTHSFPFLKRTSSGPVVTATLNAFGLFRFTGHVLLLFEVLPDGSLRFSFVQYCSVERMAQPCFNPCGSTVVTQNLLSESI